MGYNGLIALDETAQAAPCGYVCFGDDLLSDCGCFLIIGDGQVHEYNSAVNEIGQTELHIPEFIEM